MDRKPDLLDAAIDLFKAIARCPLGDMKTRTAAARRADELEFERALSSQFSKWVH